MGTYRLRVPASRVGYVPDAQGGLPPGPTYCTYGVHVPASGVGYVPRSVAPQVGIRCGQKYFDNGYTTIKSWDQNPDGPDSPLVAQPISAQVAQKKSLQEINMEITVPY